MAQIKDIHQVESEPSARTQVSADYSFSQNLFQMRTYREGDTSRTQQPTQNIQLDKNMAEDLIVKLAKFLNQ